MQEPAIVIDHFTKRFGGRAAVRDLSLQVPRGAVFGLLGQNGAGKSTTIKALLNLLQPSEGRLSVLGLDSVGDSVALRRRVGYLPEEPAYYAWMRVEEIVRFNAAFFPAWDPSLAAALMRRFELPPRRRLRELSWGMQAKVGLVMALGCRPDVLILDDPTSGLDAVVRRELMEEIIANVQADGGTVFFSTHMLHELERVADEVAILHEGRLVAAAPVERLKEQVKKLRVVYPDAVPKRIAVPGLLRAERNAHQAILTVTGFSASLPASIRAEGAESVEVIDLSLEEIFVETVKGGAGHD